MLENKRWKRWTKEELKILTKFFPDMPRESLCETLGRSWDGIRKKAKELGLKRNLDERASTWKPRAISELDLAYIAGFFDGEGSIILAVNYGEKTRVYPVCLIANTHKEVLNWVARTIGIPQGRSLRIREGKKQDGSKKCWVLRFGGNQQLLQLFHQLAPYLQVKAKQGKLLLEYLESGISPSSLSALQFALRMKELNASQRNKDLEATKRLRCLIHQLENHNGS